MKCLDYQQMKTVSLMFIYMHILQEQTEIGR
jgi:hypothetical protein